MPSLNRIKDISKGDSANVSVLSCSVHTGTHIDAPLHHDERGKTTDNIGLEPFVGSAIVVEFLDTDIITSTDLEGIGLPMSTKRLLIKTRNSQSWHAGENVFSPHYIALNDDAAEWVVKKGIRLVGIDYLSVQKHGVKEKRTHRILFEGNVSILEGINLSGVSPGGYYLVCLPLRLENSDGSPARAILLEEGFCER